MLRRSRRDGSIFAIGDVHGCADELEELLKKLPLAANSTVVFLGDYIDRGPQSRRVVELVLELKKRCEVIALRGNHEAMLLEFLDGSDPLKSARFVLNGGSATLATYADENGRYHIPQEHIDFFNSLEVAYEAGEIFFVHAGVPDIPLAELDPDEWSDELVWIRKNFLSSRFRWEKLIVHGHTVVDAVEFAPNRINLDTGCVFNGALTAMEFPSHRVYSVPRSVAGARVLLREPASRRAAVRFRAAIPVEVDIAGETMPFETVDYSEIGVCIRAIRRKDGAALNEGDTVIGRIGGKGLFQFRFRGRVVRSSRDLRGTLHGVAIDHMDDIASEPAPVVARTLAPGANAANGG